MDKKHIFMFLMLPLLIAATGWSASASDKAQASVTAPSPSAVITPNGMAVGTIHVVYTVNAYQFIPGLFGSFNLDLSILDVAGNPETTYPLTLRLAQNQGGAGSLVLTPATGAFPVADSNWTGGTTVSVTIPAETPDADGTTLTGTLQLEAEGPLDKNLRAINPQLNTVTTIVVKIVLVHPTACLKVVTFVTDAEFNPIDGAVVNLKTKGGVSTVTSTNPGQFSDNILVVNQCGTDQQIDLKINLDPCFETNPSGNPGQAVFTYLTSGEMDEESFDFSAFGAMTHQGQNLCLSGLTVPSGQTLLATVHMGAIKNMPAGNLPADSSFDFSATLYEPGSNGCTTGTLNALADQSNPAGAAVSFTTK